MSAYCLAENMRRGANEQTCAARAHFVLRESGEYMSCQRAQRAGCRKFLQPISRLNKEK